MCAADDILLPRVLLLFKYCGMALQYYFLSLGSQYQYEYMCLFRLFNYSSIYLFFLHQLTSDKTCFYDLSDRDMDGNEVKMDKFKGDVLCVVNVASK